MFGLVVPNSTTRQLAVGGDDVAGCVERCFRDVGALDQRVRGGGAGVEEVGFDPFALAVDVRGRLGARPGVVALFAADAAGKLSFVVATTAAARDAGLAAGKLVPILEDWMPPPDAYYLYYPGRRQNPAALQVLIDFFKANLKTSDSRTQRSPHQGRVSV